MITKNEEIFDLSIPLPVIDRIHRIDRLNFLTIVRMAAASTPSRRPKIASIELCSAQLQGKPCDYALCAKRAHLAPDVVSAVRAESVAKKGTCTVCAFNGRCTKNGMCTFIHPPPGRIILVPTADDQWYEKKIESPESPGSLEPPVLAANPWHDLFFARS